MDSSKLLSIHNLSVWYTEDHPVLSRFSLDLGAKETVGLIGFNGAGKTTWIKTAAGLLRSFCLDRGEWEGKPFSFRDQDFKRNRYIVFAEDRSFPYFTFREYLAYAAASYGVPLLDAANLIKDFHFEDYENVLLKELSTGNQKKASLITAFALQPKLLLLDEPVNGFDFQSTEFLYRLMSGYKEYGTILFSSHILESICLTSDRVLVLEHGRISRSFTGKEIAEEISGRCCLIMRTVKALSKQLFGAKYESAANSLLAAAILFFAVYASEWKLVIAPFILYLTSALFTAGVMWKMLGGSRHMEAVQGMFLQPFENRSFVFSYVAVLGAHTLITKTLFIWILFSVAAWNGFEMAVTLYLYFADAYDFYNGGTAKKPVRYAGRAGNGGSNVFCIWRGI